MMRKLRKAIAIAAFFPILSIASPNEDWPIGNFKLTIDSRPSTPYPSLQNYNTTLTSQGAGGNYPVTVSRHHIIPLNVLREFYNEVSRRERLRSIHGFFSVYSSHIHSYASANNINCAPIDGDLLGAENLALAQGYGIARGSGTSWAPNFDTFAQFYAWLPGNLFVGPNNRSDDPRDGFEVNAAVVVGTSYFNIAQRAYDNMQRFNSGDQNPNLYNAITHDLTIMAQRTTIFALDPDNWEYVHGSYRLKRNNQSSSKKTKKLQTIQISKFSCSKGPSINLTNKIAAVLVVI
ncbi:hypothetical protein ACMZ49_03650 [Alcaligenes phenolicus]